MATCLADVLVIVCDPSIPCADRIRAALSIGLEPRQRCLALDSAASKLDLLSDPFIVLNANDISDADWKFIDALRQTPGTPFDDDWLNRDIPF